MRKLFFNIVPMILFFGLIVCATTFVRPAVVSAASASTTSQSQACQGLDQISGANSCNSANGSAALSTAAKIVDFLSILTGIIVVIMVIVAAFQFVTSGGDSGKVGKAKTSLIYALIGLVIVALAQFLVQFVITKSSGG